MNQSNKEKNPTSGLPAGTYFCKSSPDEEVIFIPIKNLHYPFNYKKGEVEKPTLNGGEEFTYFG
ncbi:MAG: hypothetical protein ABH951_02025 [Patescibacteria group bacterium]